MQASDIIFKRHRFPPQIIAHTVWLYLRLNLSLREVEEMLHERGIDVSYETVRRWIAKCSPQIACNLRRRQVRSGVRWINMAIVLEEILQKRRDKRAAKRLLMVLMKRYGFAPKRIITDMDFPFKSGGLLLDKTDRILRIETARIYRRV